MSTWVPTHFQVTVHRARNLIGKGKGGTNNAFVTMQLGKERFQTSVAKERKYPEWSEECELSIQGMDGVVVLTVYHRNKLIDEFLGRLDLPLVDFNRYDPPKKRWYRLHHKPGKADVKDRGELEVEVRFLSLTNSEAKASTTKGNRLTRGVSSAVDVVRGLKRSRSGAGAPLSSSPPTDLNRSIEDVLKDMKDEPDVPTPPGSSPDVDRKWGEEMDLSFEESPPLRESFEGSPSVLRKTGAGQNGHARSDSDEFVVPLREKKVVPIGEHKKRRHSFHAVAGSILAFASAKIRGNQSESSKISEEPSDEYETLSHAELLKVAIQHREELERKESEMKELKAYVDKVMITIMERAPHLLEVGNSGEEGLPRPSDFALKAKSARKRTSAWRK